MNNTDGSSPFLEQPLGTPSKAINDTDSVRELISVRYKLNTLQNEFEIEKLKLEQEKNAIEKKYRATIDELEKALNDTKYLYDTNGTLEQKLTEMQNKLQQVTLSKENEIKELKLRLYKLEDESTEFKTDLESKLSNARKIIESYKLDIESSKSLLGKYEEQISRLSGEIKDSQRKNAEKDDEIATLRASRVVMAHHNYSTEELQELTITNKMLQDQLKYTNELEEKNMQQANELKRLRMHNESIEFWKNENSKLQNKADQVHTLEKQLQDCQLENINLKSKIAVWGIYDNGIDDPESIIKDWKLAKEECIVLSNENKKLHLDLNNIKILNDEMALERNQLLDLNKNYEASILNLKKLNHEFEQQKQLSFEECRLLRSQLDDLCSFNNDAGDKNETGDHLKTYENIVDQYKHQTEDLTEELRKLNEQMLSQEPSLKRKKISDQTGVNYSQKLNGLQLQNVNLLRELQRYQNMNNILEEKVQKFTEIKEKRIRILQLRNNPLLKDQFVKRKQLDLLQKENESLLKDLQYGKHSENERVPLSVYNSLKYELEQREGDMFKANKKLIRLKEIFNEKSLEFIDVVNSLLGFKLEFQQEGKVKIHSCFSPDKYLIADLRQNTLKSNLTTEIQDWDESLHLWVDERGQIPCFLATITLKLWEQSSNNT